MKHTMPEEKKSTKPVLVDCKKPQRAQRLIKNDQPHIAELTPGTTSANRV